MAKFKFDVDFDEVKISEAERTALDKMGGSSFLFENILQNVCNSIFPQGIKGPKGRAYERILKKMDHSTDGTIDLEAAEIDLLKEMIDSEESAVAPQQVRLRSYYRDRIHETQAEAEQKKAE